jgi:hypothetical protein
LETTDFTHYTAHINRKKTPRIDFEMIACNKSMEKMFL